MPEFVYAGQVPRSYPETRDEHGDLVGTAEHGDTRDFGGDGEKPDGAPDSWPAPDALWYPAGTKIAPLWEGVSAGMYRLPGGGGDAEGAESEPAAGPPAGKTPAAGKTPDAEGPAGRTVTAGASLAGAAGAQPQD